MNQINRISEGAAIQYGDPDRLLILTSSVVAPRRDTFDYIDYAAQLPYTKLFLRDDNGDCGYHRGVKGLSEDIESTVEFLTYLIGKLGPKRVSFHGASVGGYASVLFGHLVGADDIHVVSSVSFIDMDIRDSYGGGERWQNAFAQAYKPYAEAGVPPRYLDLRQVILDNPGKVGVTRVHYAATEEIDKLQAMHLKDLPNVQLLASDFEHRRAHSLLPTMMARNGKLAEDLARSVEDLLADTA